MTESSEVLQFNKNQTKDLAEICDFLMEAINKSLNDATSKLYHGSPVWFIDDSPIVGYSVHKQSINLLFWSGQSFDEPKLVSMGKHKAAQLNYQDIKDIDKELLSSCLEKSKKIMWNYKDIIKNKGKLTLLTVK